MFMPVNPNINQIITSFLYYSDILQRENMNADAIYVRGMCLYYDDNIDKAFQHFQQVLRLAPDHQKAKTTYRVSQVAFGAKKFSSKTVGESMMTLIQAFMLNPA